MKNICITGATSFIAINLLKELIKYDFSINAVIRKNSLKKGILPKSKKVKIIEKNMHDFSGIQNDIKKCDICYHFAWNGTRATVRDNKKIQYQNYKDSIKLLKELKKMKCKVFVMAGSQAEYGIKNNKMKETDRPKPITAYGKTKLKFGKYAKKYCRKNGIKFYELRFFSLYGPNDNNETLIMSSLSKMLKNEDVNLTSGNQNWNFLYIKDAIEILIKISEGIYPEGIYNVGSNYTRKLKDFIKELKVITNSSSKLNFGAVKAQEINIDPDVSKVKEILNWKEKYSFKEGIEDLLKTGECEQ